MYDIRFYQAFMGGANTTSLRMAVVNQNGRKGPLVVWV
jgi:hypothetical protein